MEIRKIGDKRFVIYRLTISHYAQIHLHKKGKYVFSFGTEEQVNYLKKYPEAGILILEEGEVDNLQRRPLLIQVDEYRKKWQLTNQVYIFYQGTGQDAYMEGYLKTIKSYVTFIRSQSAMYNFVMDWSKAHSGIEDTHTKVKYLYVGDNFLKDFNIDKKFLILGGKSRTARLMFLDKLLTSKLDKEAYMSFSNEYLKFDQANRLSTIKIENPTEELIAKPEVEYLHNTGLKLSKKDIKRTKDVHKKLPIYTLPRPTEDYYFDPYVIIPDPEFYNSIFVDIVLETFHFRGIVKDPLFSNINFFTEKIAKPLLACRPFMVLANKHYLRDLKSEFGIKTFDKYWDESYDKVDTVQEANDIVLKNMKYINSKTESQLKEMIRDMEPILRHNNEVMREYFLGKPNWIKVMNEYVKGNGVSWTGTQKNIVI